MSSLTAQEQRRIQARDVETPLIQGLTRLEAHDGLVVDATTWTVAHAYHEQASQLHGLAAHGPGVLTGLEVVPSGGRQVTVLPGVALDEAGRVMVLRAPVRLPIDVTTAHAPVVFIVLVHADEEPDEDGRVREESAVQALTTLPDEPYIELGRVTLGAHATVIQPKDARRIAAGELNISWRTQAGSHARGRVPIAELVLTEGAGHTQVGMVLARAINNDGAYRAHYFGEVVPGGTVPDGGVLYATGDAEFTLNEDAVVWLREFLDAGGTLVGDACHDTPVDPFGAAFDRLAKVLRRQLRRVQPGDRLLWAHHVFGAPPAGRIKTDTGMVLADEGIVYCASDYGCVLRGGAEAPLPRSAIHAVEEFATNLAALAFERSRAAAFVDER